MAMGSPSAYWIMTNKSLNPPTGPPGNANRANHNTRPTAAIVPLTEADQPPSRIIPSRCADCCSITSPHRHGDALRRRHDQGAQTQPDQRDEQDGLGEVLHELHAADVPEREGDCAYP